MRFSSSDWCVRVQKIFTGDVDELLEDTYICGATFAEMVEKTQRYMMDDDGLFWVMPLRENPLKGFFDYREALSTDVPEDPDYAPVTGQFQVETYGERFLVRPLRQRKLEGLE
jgi:hypothetical protein